jgi:tRNA(fMet)-specific endonuclease VapC
VNGDLFDTNIVIALFANEPTVIEKLRQSNHIFVPAIVLCELFYGVRKSNQVEQNIERVEAFAASVQVLACDADTAASYGAIKNQLRLKGRPIPENDIWIASLARQFNLRLVTRDDHFGEVDGLDVRRW